MSKVYRIKPNAFDMHKKKYIRIVLSFMILALAVGLGIAYWKTGGHAMDIYVYPFVIIMASTIMFFTIKKQLKKQEEIFNSYQLTIEEDQLVREQMTLPKVIIPIHEITEIIEGIADLSVLTVKSNSQTILIHSGIEGYQEIRQKLEAIRPITPFESKVKK